MAKKKGTPKLKKGYVLCGKCGAQYMAGAPHYMFCSACCCSTCKSTFHETLPEDENGDLYCEKCGHGTPSEDDLDA
jgi:hypothetical protein